MSVLDCPHRATTASHDLLDPSAKPQDMCWTDDVTCGVCGAMVVTMHYADPAKDPDMMLRGPAHDPHPPHSMWPGSRKEAEKVYEQDE